MAACLLVGIASFMNEQPALSVTQMLWVNLIMDTFAALALASLPPNAEVMNEQPRESNATIITKPMAQFIFGVGIAFAVSMLGFFAYLLYLHNDGGSSLINSRISGNEISLYFSTFVFLQFWNLFNAKAFDSGHSAFYKMSESKVFFMVIAIIFIGQILIVQLGGKMFNVQPMTLVQWLKVIAFTSPVLIVGEIYHLLSRNNKIA